MRVRFPLRDWIDAHEGARHNLAESGMRGSIPPPRWPSGRPPDGVLETLAAELAEHHGVDPERLFLGHGASEANGWVLGFLAREASGVRPVARVQRPEYPPLFEAARAVGFRLGSERARADVAVVSRPRNPEGTAWSAAELDRFADGARQLLVDETFREFAELPSIAREGAPGRWATGTFTKFFGGDELRVGWAIAPPEAAGRFGRYVGLVSDEVAPRSASAALEQLRNLDRVRRAVRRVVGPNLRTLRRAFPTAREVVAPVWFDRPAHESGRSLAERCLAASVLVCPGELFGDPTGVRITLTRPDFAEALRAYRDVRDRPGPSAADGGPAVRSPRPTPGRRSGGRARRQDRAPA